MAMAVPPDPDKEPKPRSTAVAEFGSQGPLLPGQTAKLTEPVGVGPPAPVNVMVSVVVVPRATEGLPGAGLADGHAGPVGGRRLAPTEEPAYE